MSNAADLNKIAEQLVKQAEAIEAEQEKLDDEIRNQLYNVIKDAQVEGDEADLKALRVAFERLDELTEWDLVTELNDGSDPIPLLRDAIQEMVDIENGGDVYGDEYEYYADLVGLRLDDHQGCWTYGDGECMDAGQQMMDALDKLQETGKMSGLTGGELLSNLAFGMKLKLPS